MFKTGKYHKQLVILDKVEKLCKKGGIEEFIFIFEDEGKIFDCVAKKDESFMAKLWSIVKKFLDNAGKRIFAF